MNNLKDLLLYIKQPYAAGVIACMWFGLVSFIAVDPELPAVQMTALTMAASIVVAIKGIRGG